MNQNDIAGLFYTLVAKKTQEIGNKLNLNYDKQNELFRKLITFAQKERQKYNDELEYINWFVNVKIDEKYRP